MAGYHQVALKQAAPPAPALLAEAILFRERERGRERRERGSALNADIGDLLLDGVAMARNLVRRWSSAIPTAPEAAEWISWPLISRGIPLAVRSSRKLSGGRSILRAMPTIAWRAIRKYA